MKQTIKIAAITAALLGTLIGGRWVYQEFMWLRWYHQEFDKDVVYQQGQVDMLNRIKSQQGQGR